MSPLLQKILRTNWILFGLMLALSIFGLYAIYSATYMRPTDYWHRQLLWMGVSVGVSFVTSLIDYRWTKWGAIPLYLASVAMLVAVQVIGEAQYGAKSWLDLGPLYFQPSQLAVVSGIMVLALFLSTMPVSPDRKFLEQIGRIFACGCIVGAPWLLILIQPDLGSAIVWVPILLGMIFIAGIQFRYLASILLIGLALIPIVVNFGLKPYQHDRIMVFLEPERDPQGAGWTITQSMIAIGSGGWSGKGFKAPNTLNELGFLPSTIVHNDFIFSVIGEQHGFIGGALLISVFGLLVLTCLFITAEAKDDLGRLLGTGITLLIFTHVFMNIGMTISVTPITGLPLPLVSYGGSFVLIVMFSFGILQSIWIHRKPLDPV